MTKRASVSARFPRTVTFHRCSIRAQTVGTGATKQGPAAAGTSRHTSTKALLTGRGKAGAFQPLQQRVLVPQRVARPRLTRSLQFPGAPEGSETPDTHEEIG